MLIKKGVPAAFLNVNRMPNRVRGARDFVLGAGFFELTALAVDQSGNLYVVDGGASIVYQVSGKALGYFLTSGVI